MKVLREFQTIGPENYAVTHKVGEEFDPKKYGTTERSVVAMVAGGFLEPSPVVEETKKEWKKENAK